MRRIDRIAVILTAALLAAGCGRPAPTQQTEARDPFKAAEGSKYLLTAEPAPAQSVLEARAKSKDGDEVVVVGRVGGSKRPLVKGRIAFTIVDASLTSCNDIPDDACPTPWDFCCAAELAKSTAMVKLVNERGQTVQEDAHEYLGIEELQTVVIQGQARRDEKGNLTILLKSIYIRKPEGKS